jgi:hypothetical protein
MNIKIIKRDKKGRKIIKEWKVGKNEREKKSKIGEKQ